MVVGVSRFDRRMKPRILASFSLKAMPNVFDLLNCVYKKRWLRTKARPGVELDDFANPKRRRFFDCVLAIEKWLFGAKLWSCSRMRV
ncbi:hypothetical protein PISMIDRAFT_676785 [Pisolithus microcarpus 441]|uniref:Uncharacterized protein n=1 Tax=Pisolithus microcarpus 441 TaxID=765257 RepID=A0A0C9Z954_9AGAM|nr:hypothetical protein PISMIDRAFT_676785 [Pisolithus microcarpus 441]